MTVTTFASLGLSETILRVLTSLNMTEPTPIQAKAIPGLLEGRDMLGIAQTGTGKTAAFALPLLQHLAESSVKLEPREIRALVLAPTRELAVQIAEAILPFTRALKLRQALVFGGVGHRPQVDAMRHGCDIVIATPGRLLDHINGKTARLDNVEHFVLDEADRMLDMGFIRDIQKIVAMLPRDRQSLLFSATMPVSISGLANSLLFEPLRVEVTPETVTVEKIAQTVYHVAAAKKKELLADLFADPALQKVLVFTRTKHGADKVMKTLDQAGVATRAIHGNKSQTARQGALESLRSGKARALVATDIAARGIDVKGITHVINFELPHEAESYVHRIGRTARAGAEGIAFSLCDPAERGALRAIERLTRVKLAIATGFQGEIPVKDYGAQASGEAHGHHRASGQGNHGQQRFNSKPSQGFKGRRGGGRRFEGRGSSASAA